MRRFGWPVFGGEWGDGISVPTAPFAPSLSTAAVIPAGSYSVGDTATASAATYSGFPIATVSYRWQYRPSGGAWTDIASSNSLSLTLTETHLGADIRIQSMATNSEGATGWGSSNEVGPIADVPAATAPRTASTATTRHVGNGHSLVDTTFYGGGWPGYLLEIRDAVFDPNDNPTTPVYIVKDTIPGSRLRWRWETTDPVAARDRPQDFDTLVTVEGGPSAHDSTPGFETEFLDFLCRFTAKMIEEGGGNDVCLQTIWPSVNGVNSPSPTPPEWQPYASFEAGLVEYGRVHEHAADYVSWKMHQLYTLPEGWRVWVFPGNEWFIRVLADIAGAGVPGLTSHLDLFRDDIHPNEWGEWGLSLFMFTCLFQTDLSGNAAVEALAPADLPSGLHDYFCTIAMEVALAYPRAGLAGTVTDLEYDPATDTDPMPFWTYAAPTTADPAPPTVDTPPSITPEGPLQGEAITMDFGAASGVGTVTGTYTLTEDGAVVRSGNVAGASTAYTVAAASGDIVLTVTWTNGYGTEPVVSDTVTIGVAGGAAPDFLISATAADYSALSGFTGTQPVVESGALRWTPQSGVDVQLGGALPASTGAEGAYMVAAIRCDPVPASFAADMIMLSSSGSTWWAGSILALSVNGFDGARWRGGVNGVTTYTTPAVSSQLGVYDILEVWTDATNMHFRINGGPITTVARPEGYVPLTHLYFFDSNGTGSAYFVAALGIASGVPSEADMTAARAWAEAQVPA